MKFEKAPTLAYIALLPLLVSLGFWQLGRAEQKQLLLTRQAQALAAPEVVDLATLPVVEVAALRYKKIVLTGHYDQQQQFLLDNQFNAGKVGYCVLSAFIVDGQEKAVLVNRGWLPLNQDRSVLPDVQFKQAPTQLAGRINAFPAVGIKLAGAEIPTATWPSVLQVVDSEVLAKKLGYPLQPFQVELDKDQAEGYQRDWQTVKIMLPEQHKAYAVQWFALAATLTLLFFGYSFKHKND